MKTAEEVGIRMAMHPDDPPLPEPLAGAARIVSTLDDYERIFALAPSPNNGMLFCQGCVSEMGIDVMETIRYMGSRKKIQCTEPKAKTYAKEVDKAWKAIQKEYRDTPWAVLAYRESLIALGMEWKAKKE